MWFYPSWNSKNNDMFENIAFVLQKIIKKVQKNCT
jgi:hypothetical protein